MSSLAQTPHQQHCVKSPKSSSWNLCLIRNQSQSVSEKPGLSGSCIFRISSPKTTRILFRKKCPISAGEHVLLYQHLSGCTSSGKGLGEDDFQACIWAVSREVKVRQKSTELQRSLLHMGDECSRVWHQHSHSSSWAC